MLLVAIVHEDDVPVRAFVDDACIFKAYQWARRHYCVDDMEPYIPVHKLPDFLKVTFHLMTNEQFQKLVNGDDKGEESRVTPKL